MKIKHKNGFLTAYSCSLTVLACFIWLCLHATKTKKFSTYIVKYLKFLQVVDFFLFLFGGFYSKESGLAKNHPEPA